MPTRARKKHRKKTSQKSILASILASQNHPKSTQHRKTSKKKAFQKKPPKKSLGPKRESTSGRNGNQRKPSLLGPRRTIQPPFQWLVLLYLSIYLSIDIPLVALIMLSKILPKPSQNPPKTLSKPSPNPPQTLEKRPWNVQRAPKLPFSRFLLIFGHFLELSAHVRE